MRNDQSYGIIPLRKIKGKWHVFLVQLYAGHWGFPKGHPEKGEDPHQAATRELLEETGLTIIKMLPASPVEENYFFKDKGILIKKNATYFLAEVLGKASTQEAEIADSKWVLLSEASKHLTFQQTKDACQQVIDQLYNMHL